jgi:hypothetical protein
LDYESAYRQLLAGANIKSVSENLEDSLLGVDVAPTSHVDFFCRWIADDDLVNRPGMEHFVVALYIDREKLSPADLGRVLECIQRNFARVAQETLAFSLCDFVARSATQSASLSVLSRLIHSATTLEALSGTLVGLDVILCYPANDVETKQAVSRLKDLARTKKSLLAQLP